MIPAWLLAAMCFLAATVVGLRGLLDRRHSAQIMVALPLAYLGAIYLLTAANVFSLADADVRTNVIRWPILLLVVSIGLAGLLSIIQARRGVGP